MVTEPREGSLCIDGAFSRIPCLGLDRMIGFPDIVTPSRSGFEVGERYSNAFFGSDIGIQVLFDQIRNR